MSNYYKEVRKRYLRRPGHGYGYGYPASRKTAEPSFNYTENQNPVTAQQPASNDSADLPLARIGVGVELALKDPPASLDPATAAGLQGANPALRAQQLAVLAGKAKAPLTLEVKESAASVQQDTAPRRFQVIRLDVAKALFHELQTPLVTARIPTHKETLDRAQMLYAMKHPNSQALQEAELVRQGYVAKAQADLIAAENAKAQQLSVHVEALRAEMGRFGYTVLPS